MVGRARGAASLHVVLDPVYVDASVRDAVAGLAVAGGLGEFTRRVSTISSATAERWALEWAFSIARSQGRRNLLFRSDAMDIVRLFRDGKPAWGWLVEHVPRKLNGRAHGLAVVARKRTLAGAAGSVHRDPGRALPPVPRWSPTDRSAA